MTTVDINIPELGQTRVFVQEDGPSPLNGYNYHGVLSLGGVTESLGDVSPIQIPSSEIPSHWENVGVSRGSPGLPTQDFTARMNKLLTDVWFKLKRTRCAVNMQAKIDTCGEPDDFASWESKLLFSRNYLTSITGPVINPLTGDDNAQADLTGSLTMLDWYVLRTIRFQEHAETEVLAEVIDGFYHDQITCGNCGAQSDGCNKAYFLTRANSGSPGLSSQLVYSLDNLATWNTLDISSLGGNSGTRMAAMGSYLVVVSENTDSHHYIRFSEVEDADATAWAEVTDGYVAGGSPRAIYVRSSSQAFIVGEGGYIYLLTNPTTGVTTVSDGSITTQNFNDISGRKDTIVAVGNSNAVVVSQNAGTSFVSQTGPAAGVNLNAVEVIDQNTWFIGTGDGRLFVTINGGDSYSSVLTGLTTINDIRFWDENVGYLVAQASGGPRIYRTDTMGNRWDYQDPWISGLPTADRYNFSVPCGPNEVATGGREEAGGDGIIAIAQ